MSGHSPESGALHTELPSARVIKNLLPAILGLVLGTTSPDHAQAAITTFDDQAEFIAATGATPAAPLPNLGPVGGPGESAVVGDLTFTVEEVNAPPFVFVLNIGAQGTGAAPDWTTLTAGNDVAISGYEHFNIDLAAPVRALGFEFVELTDDPFSQPQEELVDSTFTVTLLTGGAGGTVVDSFSYNGTNDILNFVGVASDEPFDRVEIRETGGEFGTGDVGNEYWGQFFVGGAIVLPEALEKKVDEYVGDVAAQLRPRATASLCAADKLRAAGRAADKKLDCHAQAARRGTPVQQACLNRETNKLGTEFAAAELGTDCLTSDDTLEVNALTDGFVGAIAVAARPSQTANATVAAVLRTVGRKAADKLSCHARGTQNGSSAEEACLGQAEQKFVDSFVRADPPARGPVRLEVTVVGNGWVAGSIDCRSTGRISRTCSKTFAPGSPVYLSSIGLGGDAFDRWDPDNLCIIPGGQSCSFILQGNVAITAFFGPGVLLTVGTGTTGGGE